MYTWNAYICIAESRRKLWKSTKQWRGSLDQEQVSNVLHQWKMYFIEDPTIWVWESSSSKSLAVYGVQNMYQGIHVCRVMLYLQVLKISDSYDICANRNAWVRVLIRRSICWDHVHCYMVWVPPHSLNWLLPSPGRLSPGIILVTKLFVHVHAYIVMLFVILLAWTCKLTK